MAAKWFDTADRSVLMDEETREVVGQAVLSESCWLAYDNDPSKNGGNGAVLLGSFGLRADAKKIVAMIPLGFERRRLADNSEMLILDGTPRFGDWVYGTRDGQAIWLNEQTGATQAYRPRS